jgi:hypothetical protein
MENKSSSYNRKQALRKTDVRRSYRYDIFYDIHGDMATATVMGYNIPDAKRRFKKIYGGWKITNVQRLK